MYRVRDQCNHEVWSISGAQSHTAAALSPPLKGSSMISHSQTGLPTSTSQSQTIQNRSFLSTLWILLEEVQPSTITDTGEDGQAGDFSSVIPLNLGNFRPGVSSCVSVSNQMKSLSKD